MGQTVIVQWERHSLCTGTFTVQWDRHSLCTGTDILCAVGQTLTVHWDRHSLCTGKDILCAVGQTLTVQWDRHCAVGQTLTVQWDRHSLCSVNNTRAWLRQLLPATAGVSPSVCVYGGAGRGVERGGGLAGSGMRDDRKGGIPFPDRNLF